MTTVAATLTAAAVAELVGGRLEGDGTVQLHAVGPLDRAHGDALSFLASPKYIDQFVSSRAGAVLVPPDLPADTPGPATRIVVRDPAGAIARAVAALFPPARPAPGIDPSVRIGTACRLGRDVSLGAHVVLGDGVVLGDRVVLAAGVVLEPGVQVGDDSVLDPHVVCYRGTEIGVRVHVKAGAVLGGTGFGFISDRQGHRPIPHVGGCQVGDDVQIGANSCVDRGSIGDTVIGAGTKLDNHVHIGHNARLGARCLVMGGVVVAGSARVGDDVILAGHSAIGGHFTVGDRARVGAKAGVISEVPPDTDVSGFPARPHREFLRAQAALYRLAPLVAELETIVKDRRQDG